MLATGDRRELAVEVVTRHEVAAGVLRRGDDVRAVLGRVRPRAVRVARVVGNAAVILTGQGNRPERADARTLGALVTFVALVSFRPLGSLGSARASRPGRPLLARGRYPAQATRPADVPGDPLETLVAVAELQVAQRLAVSVRLDAGVDDAVADAELAPGLRRAIVAREGDRRAHDQRDECRDQGRRPHSPSFPQGRASLGLVPRQQITRTGAGETRLLAAEAQARTAPATSAASWAASVGVVPTRTPWASRASFLPSAVPAVPEMIAPAWPIVFPGGAEKPAM